MIACKASVVCATCKRKVEVDFIAFGGGYVAICPTCGRIAYNGDKLPEEKEDSS